MIAPVRAISGVYKREVGTMSEPIARVQQRIRIRVAHQPVGMRDRHATDWAMGRRVSLLPKMADTPEQVMDFLRDLARRARPGAERDLREAEVSCRDVYGFLRTYGLAPEKVALTPPAAFAKAIGAEYVTLVTEGNSEKGVADIRAMLDALPSDLPLSVEIPHHQRAQVLLDLLDPVVVSGTERAAKPDPRALTAIDGFKVLGVRTGAAAKDNKVLMNDRVYRIGDVIRHAVPRTVSGGERALYHALYPARHALYSSDRFAQACGLPASPLDDLIAFHVVFGKTVPDVSLNAVANLGYAEGRFLTPDQGGKSSTTEFCDAVAKAL